MSLCHSAQRGRIEQAAYEAAELRMVRSTEVIGPDDGPRTGYQLDVTLTDAAGEPWQLAKIRAKYELDAAISQRQGSVWKVVLTA